MSGSELVMVMVPRKAGYCEHTPKVPPSLPVNEAANSLEWSAQSASISPVAGMRIVYRLLDV